MDTGKAIARSVSSFYAEILNNFILKLKNQQRPPYAQPNFGQLLIGFDELGGYFPVPRNLN